MTTITIGLLLASAALRTRLARASLAYALLRASNALLDLGSNAMDNIEEDRGHG
ncbi:MULTISPECIES: hypothetical protein [unclassified Mesorhizobium]|uniref:hypothetical protein n=1 Tax=unclassified Mesorhizobium TaxID=325217 RepID=UPI00167BDF74|nr:MULTISPECIES: hypothetical protein [unclassified Mesorhizobium]